jgi:FkbM family methyltransferase
MKLEIVKSYLVGTRLGDLAKRMRWMMEAPRRKRNPELSDIYLEGDRIDRVVRRLINESSNCIDIGCHIGSMLDQFVKLAPCGRHMAFEPIPWKARRLTRKFPTVDVKQMALSDSSGEVSFLIDLDRSGYSGILSSKSRTARTREIKVPCERLDRLVSADYKVDLIKIDVEGAETLVFRGARELLHRDRPALIFESTEAGLSMYGLTSTDMFKHLTGEYDYLILTPRGFLEGAHPLNLEEFDSAHRYPFKAFNFIAMPRTHSALTRASLSD